MMGKISRGLKTQTLEQSSFHVFLVRLRPVRQGRCFRVQSSSVQTSGRATIRQHVQQPPAWRLPWGTETKAFFRPRYFSEGSRHPENRSSRRLVSRIRQPSPVRASRSR
jgi:hypothetical protein